MAGFPIFIELGGVPPLVIGSSDLTAAKVRVLLLRADRVDLVPTGPLAESLAGLITEGRTVRCDAGPINEAELRGRPLVISATGDDAEDARISALARGLGVPVNVPDRPHLCTFSLAAIVDRGTVTVAIGTEGAAPVLATRLRAQIEQLLHPRLGRLADVARSYREVVGARLSPGAQRRSFWERVFAGPAAKAILDGDEARGQSLIDQALSDPETAAPAMGRLILVGAGPGDPDLLTLKAVRALKSADVILYDGLMGEGVLAYARREAQLVFVGKAKGRHARTQAEINALILEHVQAGKTVVRLKTGDPSVFGRGGEEIDLARASGVPIEVIPGITAATAAAAALQIPLTHRDVAHAVTFISGHAADTGTAAFDQVDFAALANGRSTLAVYMGLSTSGALAERLLEAGWARKTPVIAIARISQAGERRIATTLDALLDPATRTGLSGPTLLLIGEIASLDPAGPLEWRHAHPRNVSPVRELAHA